MLIEGYRGQPRHYDKLQAVININIKISVLFSYVVLHVYLCGLPLCTDRINEGCGG